MIDRLVSALLVLLSVLVIMSAMAAWYYYINTDYRPKQILRAKLKEYSPRKQKTGKRYKKCLR